MSYILTVVSGRPALDFDGVIVEREQLDAVAGLMDRTACTQALSDARDALVWSAQTSCQECTDRPSVARDEQGAPLCESCDQARSAMGWAAS